MSNRTDIVVETDNAEGQVLLSASRVYDLTEDKTQDTINSEVKNTLNQLDSAKAAKSDLASPTNKTTPNNDSNPIYAGNFFYLDGELVQAMDNIAANAPFTENTNYKKITSGALNGFLWRELGEYNIGETITWPTSAPFWQEIQVYCVPTNTGVRALSVSLVRAARSRLNSKYDYLCSGYYVDATHHGNITLQVGSSGLYVNGCTINGSTDTTAKFYAYYR